MSDGVVVVTARSFGSGKSPVERQLTVAGLRVVRCTSTHDLAEMRPVLAEAVAWIAGAAPVAGEHLAAAPRLRVLARYGVGVDAVDLDAAAAHDVVVTNTPGANSEAVADLTLTLLLAALRGLPAGDRSVRDGSGRVRRGRELGQLTLGLVGLGRIGTAVTQRVRGFGTTVLGYDPYLEPSHLADSGVRRTGIGELVSTADVISLHLPGGHMLLGETWLRRIKPGSVLVNTARADLVDEAAVADALRSDRLAVYAVDTLSGEHAGRPSPLLDDDLADRVVLTPHLGAQTTEAVDRMGTSAVRSVLEVLANRRPADPVALPTTRHRESST